MHGGDEMCCQRRYNLSLATNCAGATKCAVTGVLFEKANGSTGQQVTFAFHYIIYAQALCHTAA